MYSFRDDYSEGCHPAILEALVRSNFIQQDGYGDDSFSAEAREIIKQSANNPNADIYFVSGGTQANLIVIASALRPHESVICAVTGHIAVHEAGAIESTGHKLNTIIDQFGKVNATEIERILEEHSDVPHMVKPRLVYISNSTEVGTIYSKKELQELYAFCKKRNLYLFMDGARLGSALSALSNDLTLADIAANTDVFYIGGTKNGALLGEAIVINNEELKYDFAFHLKQRGALLAKGKLLGIQFAELFRNGLYFELAKQANKMAAMLSEAFVYEGFKLLAKSETNQIFPILPNTLIEKLSAKYAFFIWKKIDGHSAAVRLVTSWATPLDKVEEFIADLKKF